jgi:hypothetical protein
MIFGFRSFDMNMILRSVHQPPDSAGNEQHRWSELLQWRHDKKLYSGPAHVTWIRY